MTTKRVTYRERPQPIGWTHVQTSLSKAIGVDYAGSGMPDAWYISRLVIDRQLRIWFLIAAGRPHPDGPQRGDCAWAVRTVAIALRSNPRFPHARSR
jgi:hypothetical protein